MGSEQPAESLDLGVQASIEQAELDVYGRMPIVVARGAGVYVWDLEGRRYLDLYGGHAVCATGHAHPHVVEAIRDQAGRLLFYSSAVYEPTRARASRMLAQRAPVSGSRVFHCCSGSEANEAAIKLARKVTGRPKIVSFEGAFHGRTLGALAACGIERYRKTAGGVLPPEHVQIPFGDFEALEAAIDQRTAAVLCEPIQSLRGVRMAPLSWYRALEERVQEAGALLVFDEVQCGMGRTGKLFCAERLGVRPHVITLAKALASGVPAAALIVCPEVAARAERGDQGSTFGGGPLAMAALAATLEVIERERLCENAERMGALLRERTQAIDGVREVRGLGLLVGIETAWPAAKVQAALRERGVIVGTAVEPNVLRLLPPLTIGAEHVEVFAQALAQSLSELGARGMEARAS